MLGKLADSDLSAKTPNHHSWCKPMRYRSLMRADGAFLCQGEMRIFRREVTDLDAEARKPNLTGCTLPYQALTYICTCRHGLRAFQKLNCCISCTRLFSFLLIGAFFRLRHRAPPSVWEGLRFLSSAADGNKFIQ